MKGYLTVMSAARRLGRDQSTIHRWIRCGLLDAILVDGIQHVAIVDVETVVPPRMGAPPRDPTRDWRAK
jgi:hypothetical protein